ERLPRYRFAHAIVQSVLYDEIGAARRARLHRQLAETLATRPGAERRAAELAHHWGLATGPHAAEQASIHAEAAGRAALDQLAHAEAAAWSETAIGHLGRQREATNARRCDLLVELGEAKRRAGDPSYRETLLDAARL